MRLRAGRSLPRLAILLAGALWITGIAAGYQAMWRFQREAGESATAPRQWPASTHLVRAANGPTLIVFAHPRCPCTRASIAELRELLGRRAAGAMKTYVLVLKPRDFPDGWEKTDIWRSSASIEGVTVIADVDGAEAARLGAKTSGQALLYDRNGRLVFQGGITALRGEAGDNAGVRTLHAAMSGAAIKDASTPVYGCAIRTARGKS